MQTKFVSPAKFKIVSYAELSLCARSVMLTIQYKVMASASIMYHLIQPVIPQVSITTRNKAAFNARKAL